MKIIRRITLPILLVCQSCAATRQIHARERKADLLAIAAHHKWQRTATGWLCPFHTLEKLMEGYNKLTDEDRADLRTWFDIPRSATALEACQLLLNGDPATVFSNLAEAARMPDGGLAALVFAALAVSQQMQ